jgi:hypothetical protein
LGAEGREFESRRPDHFFSSLYLPASSHLQPTGVVIPVMGQLTANSHLQRKQMNHPPILLIKINQIAAIFLPIKMDKILL